jgi:hypothetical protein
MTDFVVAECGIRQLHARCLEAIWRKDAHAFANCFSETGEWKIAGLHMRGRAEIEATFGKLLGLCEKVHTTIGAPLLEVGEGTAFGRVYVAENAKLMNGQFAHTLGIYFDRYVEEGGQWKFQWRHWSLQYRGPSDFSAPFYDSPDYGPHPGMPAPDEPTTVKRPE